MATQILSGDETGARLSSGGAVIGARGAELANTLFYYWRTALGVLLLTLVLGLLAALLLPPRYQAEARLLALTAAYYDVRTDRPGAPPAPGFQPADVLNVEMQLLSSADLHRDTIARLSPPAANAVARDRDLRSFERNLHVGKAEDANVIILQYADRDPARAAAALQALVQAYFVKRAAVLTSGRAGLLGTQRDDAKRELDEISRQIARFQAQNGVVDIQAQIDGAVSIDTQLRQAKLAADSDRSKANGNLALLESGAKSVPQTVELYRDDSEVAAAIGTMQARLLDVEARRADIAARYLPGSPQMAKADKEIASLKQAIRERSATLKAARRVGRNDHFDAVRDRVITTNAEVAGETARAATLVEQIGQSQARLRGLMAVSQTLANLKLQRDLLVETYRDLAGQYERARAEQQEAATGSTNVRVIQAPRAPDRQINPPWLLIAGSLLAGLVLAATSVFVRASLRTTFLSPGEAGRALDLPVMASIERPALADEALLAERVAVVLPALGSPSSGPAVVALIAATPDPDLWTVGTALARALHRRWPERTALLHFEPGAYVDREGTPLASPKQQQVGGGAVYRMGTRAWSAGATGERFIGELRGQYARILLIAPPANGHAMVFDMAPLVDATLIMVRADHSRRADMETLLARLETLGVRPAGLIFTDQQSWVPAALRRWL